MSLTREIFVENGLDKETDVYSDKRGFSIITRSGIEKIQAKRNIRVSFEMVHLSDDHKFVIFKAIGKMGDKIVESFGEASPANTRQSYPVAIAEKRALSRVVLKLAGLYALGCFGEDENDSFNRTNA